MRARILVGIALVGAAFVACSSVPDVTFSDSPGNPDSAVSIDGSPNDGGTDTGPIPGCTPLGPEICDDGVDNDCNGKTDCDDPACTTHACFDAPPTGWTAVVLSPTQANACPGGYQTTSDVKVIEGDGSFGCACSCTGAGGVSPQCNNGNHTLDLGPDNTCGALTQTVLATTNNNCQSIAMFDAPAFAKITPPTGPTTCSQVDVPTKANLQDGRECTSTAAGGGCGANRVCKPKAGSFLECVMQAGNQACPPGFPKRHRAGKTATDARTCTGCTCTASPCTAEVQLFGNPNCNGGVDSTIATATHAACSAATATNNVRGYKSKIGGGCAAGTASTASGTISFGTEETICCK